jgi:hypothetical protein
MHCSSYALLLWISIVQVFDISGHHSASAVLKDLSDHFEAKNVDRGLVERTRVVIFANCLNVFHALQVRLLNRCRAASQPFR